uniref:hypothetical protein n=1 Tax=Fulvivirga sp. TaxID=1931237 RepID=UPI0040497DBE
MKVLTLSQMEVCQAGSCMGVAMGAVGMIASVASGPGPWGFIGFAAGAIGVLDSWSGCFE